MKLAVDKEIQAFREGKFRLEFDEVNLSPNSPTKKRPYVGPGLAAQAPDGTIAIECRPDKPRMDEFRGRTFEVKHGMAGTIYADDDYYDCRARDREGRVWTATRLLVPESILPPFFRQTVSCTTRSLRCNDESIVVGTFLHLEFFNQDRENWRWLYEGVHRIIVEQPPLSFDLTIAPSHESGVAVVVRSEASLPSPFEHRLVEALAFVLDVTLDVAIVERADDKARDIELCAPREIPAQSFPRISFRPGVSTYRQSFNRLMSRYLSYIHNYKYDADRHWHPCSNFLSLARQSSGLSLEAWALGISVAAEGIASLVEHTKEPLSNELTEARREILRCLEGANYEQSTKKRIQGLLRQLDNPQIKDRMWYLVRIGHACKSDVEAWDHIRNKYVHLKIRNQSGVIDEDFEKTYFEIHQVYRLISSMIFHLIGYEGECTNYAVPGFPNEKFPFHVVE